jgi:hypothetical protein
MDCQRLTHVMMLETRRCVRSGTTRSDKNRQGIKGKVYYRVQRYAFVPPIWNLLFIACFYRVVATRAFPTSIPVGLSLKGTLIQHFGSNWNGNPGVLSEPIHCYLTFQTPRVSLLGISSNEGATNTAMVRSKLFPTSSPLVRSHCSSQEQLTVGQQTGSFRAGRSPIANAERS